MDDGSRGTVKRMNGMLACYMFVALLIHPMLFQKRLFFGCSHYANKEVPKMISSIREIETRTNHAEMVKTIRIFDKITSDEINEKVKTSSSSVQIIDGLFNANNQNDFKLNIHQTFKLFLDQKTEIKINMKHLSKNVAASFLDAIFGATIFQTFSKFTTTTRTSPTNF